jgi:hypothetical protein
VLVGLKWRDFGWLGAGALVLLLGSAVTEYPVNAFRVAGMLPVLWAFGPNFKALPSIRRQQRLKVPNADSVDVLSR